MTNPNNLYNQSLAIIEEIIPGETDEDILQRIGNELFEHQFIGVYASNEIKNIKMNNNDMAIVNLATRGQQGSHWVGIVKTEHHDTIIYDSYGRNSDGFRFGIPLRTDTEYDPEQTLNEENCGARVLAWLWTFYRLGSDAALMI